jgi:hypothetical protein
VVTKCVRSGDNARLDTGADSVSTARDQERQDPGRGLDAHARIIAAPDTYRG